MNNADMPAIPNSILTNAVLPGGHIEPYVKTDGGLTKREYIAAMAMQGELASGDSPTPDTICDVLGISDLSYKPLIHYPQFIAKVAIGCADALLEELEK